MLRSLCVCICLLVSMYSCLHFSVSVLICLFICACLYLFALLYLQMICCELTGRKAEVSMRSPASQSAGQGHVPPLSHRIKTPRLKETLNYYKLMCVVIILYCFVVSLFLSVVILLPLDILPIIVILHLFLIILSF